MIRTNFLYFIAFIASLAAISPAAAKSSDRDLQAEIKAGRFIEDPENDTQVFSGGFTLRQGTLAIQGQTATIHRGAEGGFARIVLEGQPAQWSEELDDGSPLDARANVIDYDVDAELVILRGDVRIDKSGDQLSGELVRYDLKTQRLDAGSEGQGQVIMIMKPRGRKE